MHAGYVTGKGSITGKYAPISISIRSLLDSVTAVSPCHPAGCNTYYRANTKAGIVGKDLGEQVTLVGVKVTGGLLVTANALGRGQPEQIGGGMLNSAHDTFNK